MGPEAAQPRTARLVRALRTQAYASFGGVLVGVGFLAISLTPSLLPRTWLTQGLISGVSTTTGYAIGTVLGRLVPVRLPPRVRRVGWYTVAALGLPLLGTLAYQSSRWQRGLYTLMGEPPPARIGYLRIGLVICAVFAVLLA